ncbi:MAG: AsmA-like C-terminal region-containing protein [Cellulophaga sp.]
MKKKIVKSIGVLLFLIIGVLVAAPFLLKNKISEIIKAKVNNNINAEFDFSEADLSLFANFPKAKVTLKNIVLINKAPFAGDTLFASQQVALKMSISELFKGVNEPIKINSLTVDTMLVNIQVDANENANYDIAKKGVATEEEVADTEESNFIFDLDFYAISNGKIIYSDMSTGMRFELNDMQHSGNGEFSTGVSQLDTKTRALVSFEMDSTHYFNRNKIELNALIGIDLEENKYSFLKNNAVINQLPLVFDGFIKLNDDNQEVAINFKTPSSDFKNFLGVIPEVYSKNIEMVKTTGNFSIIGKFNGIVDENHIPKFSIQIDSDNASFKYPDLPKIVKNVRIDIDILNTTGIVEDTYVDIKKLSFMIDEDTFNMVYKITNLLGNTKVDAKINGIMNLANIAKAYPVPSDLNLKGILKADIATLFDMTSIESEKYENTKTTGKLNLKDFEYASGEIPNPVKINSTTVTFNPKTVTLNEFNGETGRTDFNAKGTIDNLLGFLFNDEKVKGDFSLQSNTFDLGDFMVEEVVEGDNPNQTTEPSESQEKIKIPSFLDCTIKASANTVYYDNLILKNVTGNLLIKEEKAILTNMSSSLFDGKLSFNGEVSTKNDVPTFAMKLGMDSFKMGETLKAMEMFNVLAPIATALKGKLNSDIEISGKLNDDFTPNLSTISGNVLAELLTTKIDTKNAKILTGLTDKLSFINLNKLDLRGLKTMLSFKDGKVQVKPFTIKYQDIDINISGNHTFDKKLNYKASIDVPAKYLGTEIRNLIAKIGDDSLLDLKIPVSANIGGLYSNPEIKTDISSGVKLITKKLIAIEKQKLLAKGKEKVTSLISDILGGNSSSSDSTKSETKNDIKEVLGSLLGGSKKVKDSTVAKKDTVVSKNEKLKDAATNILGGFFRNKKKKDTVN